MSLYDELRKQNTERCARYGLKPGELQARWRGLGPGAPISVVNSPAFTQEAEHAILDALVEQGGVSAWSGDGTSCVAQIVRNIAEQAEQRQAEAFKSLLLAAEAMAATGASAVHLVELIRAA